MYTWVSVGLPGGVSGKEPAYNARLIRDMGSILGLGRSPGRGTGSPLQYSCLQTAMDRGAWRTTVHRVSKNWTQLKQLSTHAHNVFGSAQKT